MTEEEKTTEDEKVVEEGKAAEESKKLEEDKSAEEGKTVEEGEKPDAGKKAEKSEKTEEDKSAVDGKAAEESEKQEESKKTESSKKSDEKPLDKMTIKELKEIAKEIPEITGAHGMNKPDLLATIKKSRGIEKKNKKKKDISLLDLKKKIKSLKIKREEALASKDKKIATIFKRKIARLKKRTRRAA